VGDAEWVGLALAVGDAEWVGLALAVGDAEWVGLALAVGDAEWVGLALAVGDAECVELALTDGDCVADTDVDGDAAVVEVDGAADADCDAAPVVDGRGELDAGVAAFATAKTCPAMDNPQTNSATATRRVTTARR
jgi:hypothetical protein